MSAAHIMREANELFLADFHFIDFNFIWNLNIGETEEKKNEHNINMSPLIHSLV